MSNLPNMTSDEAYLYLCICEFRFMGWEVAERTKHHPNSSAAKRSFETFRDIIVNQPKPDFFVAAAMAGEPVHLLWPDELHAEVERQINTKVPRAINEPTSEEFAKSMSQGGRTDWELPNFLKNHGKDA